MIRCPCCDREPDWRPWRVNGQLLLTWHSKGVAYTAKADVVVTEVRAR